MVAMPLSGDRTGQVVATSSPLSADDYVEQSGVLGNSPAGVINVVTNEIIMPHLDTAGAPVELPDPWPISLVSTIDVSATDGHIAEVVAFESTRSSVWDIEIQRAADAAGLISVLHPAPTYDGGAVVTAWIGPRLSPDPNDNPDGTPTGPAVAVLRPDGSGEWLRLPDEWNVAASDLWGTILTRVTPGHVELAWLQAEGLYANPLILVRPISIGQLIGSVSITQLSAISGVDLGAGAASHVQLTRDGNLAVFNANSHQLIIVSPTGELISTVPLPADSDGSYGDIQWTNVALVPNLPDGSDGTEVAIDLTTGSGAVLSSFAFVDGAPSASIPAPGVRVLPPIDAAWNTQGDVVPPGGSARAVDVTAQPTITLEGTATRWQVPDGEIHLAAGSSDGEVGLLTTTSAENYPGFEIFNFVRLRRDGTAQTFPLFLTASRLSNEGWLDLMVLPTHAFVIRETETRQLGVYLFQ